MNIIIIWVALIALKAMGFPLLRNVSWGLIFLYPLLHLAIRLIAKALSFVFWAALGFGGTYLISQLILWIYE